MPVMSIPNYWWSFPWDERLMARVIVNTALNWTDSILLGKVAFEGGSNMKYP